MSWLKQIKGKSERKEEPGNLGSFLSVSLHTFSSVLSLFMGCLRRLPLYILWLIGPSAMQKGGSDWYCLGFDSVAGGAGSCSRNMEIPRAGGWADHPTGASVPLQENSSWRHQFETIGLVQPQHLIDGEIYP